MAGAFRQSQSAPREHPLLLLPLLRLLLTTITAIRPSSFKLVHAHENCNREEREKAEEETTE